VQIALEFRFVLRLVEFELMTIRRIMTTSFRDLGVPTPLVERLEASGIKSPFPIQEATLPDALAGRDVVGRAPTGSGKTLAFGLALLARTGRSEPYQPQGLVLVPTRELAAQVQQELATLTADRGRRIITIYGGTSYTKARKSLAEGVDIVVACPGRLEDILRQDEIDLSNVKTVVVDEADRMADMGFLPAVQRIIALTEENRQVMLFSATFENEVRSLVSQFTANPIRHDVASDSEPTDVDHFFWKVGKEERISSVVDVVKEHGRAVIFCRTKFGVDRLAFQLSGKGVRAVPLHGDRSQAQREAALRQVIKGEADVLVATDVAARGIHIEELPCVIHYDPPQVASDYVHRSGRTGRAGETGVVISLVAADTVGKMKKIMREVGLPPIIGTREEAEGLRLQPKQEDSRPLVGKANKPEPAALSDLEGPFCYDTPPAGARRDGDRRERSPRRDDWTPRDSRRGPRDDRRGPREDRPSYRDDRRPAREGDRPAFRDDRRPAREGDRPAFRDDRRPAREGERPAFRDERPSFREDRRPARDGDRPAFREDRPSFREERPAFRDDRRPARDGERPRFRDERSDSRPTATVTFFNELKGYGFATRESGEEVFIHFSQVMGNDGRVLSKGQTVALDVVSGPKGLEGHNVRVQGGFRPQGGGSGTGRRPEGAGRRPDSRRPGASDRKPRRKY